MVGFAFALAGLYLLTGLLPLLFLRPIRNQWDKPGGKGLFIAVIGLGLWSLCDGVHLLVPTAQAANFVWNARLAATSVTVVGWFLAVGEYTGLCRPTKRAVLGLSVVPAVSQVFVWTNSAHHLQYGQATAFRSVESIVTNYGPVFYGNVIYLYGLAAVALALLLPEVTGNRRLRQLQSLALFTSAIPVIVTNLVHLTLLPGIDLTSFGFVLTLAIVGWALLYGRFLDVVPVARDRLVSNMSDPVVTLDAEHRVVDSNPAARQLCDIGSDYSGTDAAAFFDPFPGLVDQLDTPAQLSDEMEVTAEETGRHYDLQVSSIRGPNEQPAGKLIVFRDVTERKQREHQLQQTNERLDQFASFVSHDLRNPLQVAAGHLDLLQQTGDLDHAEQIDDSLERMESMIADLRTLTSADEDRLDLATVDLAETAEDGWAQIDHGGATLRVADRCSLVADRELLRHVFENLFRNAVEHGGTGGDDGESERTVTVGCLADEDGFYVEDDGVGIPESERDAILEYGYSSDGAGTGFGLAIVKTVSTVHGWAVSVAESSDGGARFEFAGVESGDGDR